MTNQTIYSSIPFFVLVAAFLLPGCSRDLPCDGPEEDCACETDEDCTLTAYGEEVTSEAECYDVECSCDVSLNDEAAARNEQSWQDMGCADIVEHEDCVDCAPGYSDRAACVDSVCVKPMAGGTQDPQPRPGWYL